MGEVQYIVTLPQANQPSAIQLPSNCTNRCPCPSRASLPLLDGQVIQLSPAMQSPMLAIGVSTRLLDILHMQIRLSCRVLDSSTPFYLRTILSTFKSLHRRRPISSSSSKHWQRTEPCTCPPTRQVNSVRALPLTYGALDGLSEHLLDSSIVSDFYHRRSAATNTERLAEEQFNQADGTERHC